MDAEMYYALRSMIMGNKNASLTNTEKARYHKQMIFADWGEEG